MGRIKCNKHGYSGVREACEHVDEEFKKGINHNFHSIKHLSNMLICNKCWEKHGLTELEKNVGVADKYFWEIEEDTPVTDKYWEIYDSIDRRCWCSQCIAEIQLR
jgi:hypothetical protein